MLMYGRLEKWYAMGCFPLQMRMCASAITTSPEQQRGRGTQAKLVLNLLEKKLYLVLWWIALLCILAGYGWGVIQLLLMRSGDVERNPGPGKSWVSFIAHVIECHEIMKLLVAIIRTDTPRHPKSQVWLCIPGGGLVSRAIHTVREELTVW